MLNKNKAITKFNEIYNTICKPLNWKYEFNKLYDDVPSALFIQRIDEEHIRIMRLDVLKNVDDWYILLSHFSDIHVYENYKPTLFEITKRYTKFDTNEMEEIKKTIINSHKLLKFYLNEFKKHQIRKDFKMN